MADTPPKPPAPPRRKASTGPRKTTRATPPKTSVPAGEDSGEGSAVKAATPRKAPTKRAATGATARKPRAPKTESSAARATTAAKSAATKASRTAGSAASKVADTASNAAQKVAGGASSARRSVAQSAPVQLVSDTRERMGDRNFFAAVIGGVAAIGAAIGGIFYTLRDGNPNKRGGGDGPVT